MKLWHWLIGSDLIPAYECMRHDAPLITAVILLNAAVAVGYLWIAILWRRARQNSPDSEAKRSLTKLIYIFLFCGLNGYAFTIIRIFIPLWRPYVFSLAMLVIITWWYVVKAGNLRIIFRALDRERAVSDKIVSIVDHADLDPACAELPEIKRLLQSIRDGATRANDSLDLLSSK